MTIYLIITNLKEEKFILAHRLKGFGPWSVGPVPLALFQYIMTESPWWRIPVYLMVAREERGRKTETR